MGCTIYAASPKALPADEAPGQDRYYQLPQYRHPHGNCSQRIAASRARSGGAPEVLNVRHDVCLSVTAPELSRRVNDVSPVS